MVGRKRRVLRLTEVINAADYLEKAVKYLFETNADLMNWKWVTISLQGALYGFAICGAEGTSFFNVLKRKDNQSLDDLHQSFETSGKIPDIVGIRRAIKLCKEKGIISLNKDEDDAINFMIDELRNNFEHYRPGHWSIILNGAPRIFCLVFGVVQKLIESDEFNHRWPSERRRNKAITQCKRSIRFLNKLKQEYQETAVKKQSKPLPSFTRKEKKEPQQ